MALFRREVWDGGLFLDRPLFVPLRSKGEGFRRFQSWPSVGDYNAILLNNHEIRSDSGAVILFEVQEKAKLRKRKEPLTISSMYEGRIYTTGRVPTRPCNWHDLFNAMVWAAFPRSKRALNARHFRAASERLGGAGLSGARTREQDALAIVDEGGLLVLCEREAEAEVDALLARADTSVLPALLGDARAAPMIIGHAVYEHLMMSSDWVRAYVVLLSTPMKLPADWDERRRLGDELLAHFIECDENLRAPSGKLGVPVFEPAEST